MDEIFDTTNWRFWSVSDGDRCELLPERSFIVIESDFSRSNESSVSELLPDDVLPFSWLSIERELLFSRSFCSDKKFLVSENFVKFNGAVFSDEHGRLLCACAFSTKIRQLKMLDSFSVRKKWEFFVSDLKRKDPYQFYNNKKNVSFIPLNFVRPGNQLLKKKFSESKTLRNRNTEKIGKYRVNWKFPTILWKEIKIT